MSKSKFHQAIKGPRWDWARRDSFDRDGWRCRRCDPPGKLEAHHIHELQHGGGPYALENLETFYRYCHIKLHHPPGPDRAEWREFARRLLSVL